MEEITVGAVLAARRRAMGLSARSCSLSAGLSESVAGKVEAGVMEPSLKVFSKLAVRLELSTLEIAFLVRLGGLERSS